MLYLANLSKEIFAATIKNGFGRLDIAEIHKFFRRKVNENQELKVGETFS